MRRNFQGSFSFSEEKLKDSEQDLKDPIQATSSEEELGEPNQEAFSEDEPEYFVLVQRNS